ncbi:MAG: response regulator [Hyphomonadaceae bacterium]|nr:response regulator [Hyphomonadaceae bacterium]
MALATLDVLIVDDHEAMRVLFHKMLERAGVTRVRDAASGAAALAHIAEHTPNLILCDRRMPEMDGLAFTQRARASLPRETCRIIIITGQGSEAAHVEALAAGADAMLVKPVSPRDLLAAIEALYA